MRIITIVFSLSILTQSIGQTNIDSLKLIWENPIQPDTVRLEAINTIAWDGFLYSNPDSAYYYAQLKFNFAKNKGLQKQMARALNIQGGSFYVRGDYANAINYFSRSLAIKVKLGDKKGASYSLNNIGAIYFEQGEFGKAIDHYNQSLTIKKEIKDERGTATILINIGEIYSEQNHEKAFNYLKRGLVICQEIDDKLCTATALKHLGIHFMNLENNSLAKAYLTQGLTIFKELEHNIGISICLNNIGNIYKKLGDSIHSTGNTFLSKENYIKSIHFSEQSLSIAQEMHALAQIRDASKSLYEVHQASENYKEALEMFKIYFAIRDSIENEENQNELMRQEFKYIYEKEKLSDELVHKATITKEKNRRYILYIILILFGLFATYAFRAWRIRRKLSKTLELSYSQLQELDNYKESMIAMCIHDLKNSLNTVISFSEDVPTERRLQGINQAGKFMLNMVLNMLDVQKFETTTIKLSTIDSPINKVINDAIDQLSYLINQKSINLTYSQKDEFLCRIDYDLIARTIVNILSNAIKFTPTNGKIDIEVEQKDDSILLSIKDNGPGIAIDQIDKVFDKYSQINAKKSGSVRSTGIGLTFCKMVVEAHNGNIDVESAEGQGSNFYFTLPIIEKIEEKDAHIEQISIAQEQEIVFSEKEKSLLEPYIKMLEKWEVYDYSEVAAIIKNIDGQENKNIIAWKERMMKAIQNGNEADFQKLNKL